MTAHKSTVSQKIGLATATTLAALFMAGGAAQAHTPGKGNVVCTSKGCVKIKPHRHAKKRVSKRRIAKSRFAKRRALARKIAQKRNLKRVNRRHDRKRIWRR